MLSADISHTAHNRAHGLIGALRAERDNHASAAPPPAPAAAAPPAPPTPTPTPTPPAAKAAAADAWAACVRALRAVDAWLTRVAAGPHRGTPALVERSDRFQGKRENCAFRKGDEGVGYYTDVPLLDPRRTYTGTFLDRYPRVLWFIDSTEERWRRGLGEAKNTWRGHAYAWSTLALMLFFNLLWFALAQGVRIRPGPLNTAHGATGEEEGAVFLADDGSLKPGECPRIAERKKLEKEWMVDAVDKWKERSERAAESRRKLESSAIAQVPVLGGFAQTFGHMFMDM